METIYADSLFLLNALIDYLLLLSAGKLCGLPLRRGRMALGAAWGGVYAVLALLRPGFFALTTVKLLSGVLAVAVAFGLSRRTVRAAVAFFAVSAAFAGAVYAAAGLAGRPLEGGLYVPVSMRTLALSFALCYAAVSLAFRRLGRRTERRLRAVEVALGDRTAAFTALEDSGNELWDPVTGNGVLVASAGALAPLFADPAPLSAPDPLSALEPLNRQSGGARFRLLPCGTVTAERALLLCFTPDGAKVDGNPRRDLSVAVCPHSLSPDGEYQAVISS